MFIASVAVSRQLFNKNPKKMYVYKISVILCCLVMTVCLADGRLMRKKRAVCEHGTYEHEGKTCCKCNSGSRVEAHCTDSDDTQCKLCERGSVTTHPNSGHTCQQCKACNSNANMIVAKTCSLSLDTVCECQEDYYCDKGDQCKVCYPCDKCEELGGVKIKCTTTSNTVCIGAEVSNSKTIGIVIGIVLTLAFIVALAVFLWSKKMFCFNDKETKEMDELHAQDPLTLPEDVDLNPHIQEIASIMKSSLMKDVARRTGMTPADIDQHEKNHPGDVKEQTYRLLQDWSQAQGLKEAYPTLIKTLLALKAKTTADHIRQIVEGGQGIVKSKILKEV